MGDEPSCGLPLATLPPRQRAGVDAETFAAVDASARRRYHRSRVLLRDVERLHSCPNHPLFFIRGGAIHLIRSPGP